jgi:hypothetical protein
MFHCVCTQYTRIHTQHGCECTSMCIYTLYVSLLAFILLLHIYLFLFINNIKQLFSCSLTIFWNGQWTARQNVLIWKRSDQRAQPFSVLNTWSPPCPSSPSSRISSVKCFHGLVPGADERLGLRQVFCSASPSLQAHFLSRPSASCILVCNSG